MDFLKFIFGNSRQDQYDKIARVKDQERIANEWYDENLAKYGDEFTKQFGDRNMALQYGASLLGDDNEFANLIGNADEIAKAEKSNRNNYLGNGLLGAVTNPLLQTGSALKSLATSGTKDWENGNRDALSDLGAVGESALTFVPVAKGASIGAKGASLGSKALKGATLGAGFGATNTLRENGKNTNGSDLLSGAGTGALFGGAIPVVGGGLSKMFPNISATKGLGNKAKAIGNYAKNNKLKFGAGLGATGFGANYAKNSLFGGQEQPAEENDYYYGGQY